MKRRVISVLLALGMGLLFSACGTENKAPAAESSKSVSKADSAEDGADAEEVSEEMMEMMIGDTKVAVDWEKNESVEALRELCSEEPLVIQMSMYGGFEQVGPIGTDLPRDDVQTATSAGDLMLYSGNQLSVFYGSNSWAYTKLGHITDRTEEELAELLGNGDVTITFTMSITGG